jgi:hypothetical protein
MECLLATSHHSYENDIVLPVVPVELALNRKRDRHETRRIAANIAKLPELLTAVPSDFI